MIVFVARHADRKPDPADGLTPTGEARARALARLLGESGVTLALRSEFTRARQTVEPLAQRLGSLLRVREVALGDADAAAYGRRVAEAVRQAPANAAVLVIGHSDTVGPTIESLGGAPVAAPAQDEFDNLFVLAVPLPEHLSLGGRTSVARMRYGDPAPAA